MYYKGEILCCNGIKTSPIPVHNMKFCRTVLDSNSDDRTLHLDVYEPQSVCSSLQTYGELL